ncbi:MAG TPA: hypothetical protein VGE15_03365 [Sphingobacteriaceae bacterium]
MNQKRTFGTILTILGIVGLVYAGVNFANGDNGSRVLIVYGVLGLIFFFTGISLIRNTRDAER